MSRTSKITPIVSQEMIILRNAMFGIIQHDSLDLTARQTAVLLLCAMRIEPQYPRNLAAELKVGTPVITRVFDRLEKAGLIVRRREREDLRNVYAVLTAAGTVFLEELQNRMKPFVYESRGAMPDGSYTNRRQKVAVSAVGAVFLEKSNRKAGVVERPQQPTVRAITTVKIPRSKAKSIIVKEVTTKKTINAGQALEVFLGKPDRKPATGKNRNDKATR